MNEESCLFCKFVTGEIKKEFLYEDDEVMVFPDIHPVKPVHLLIVPKVHVPELSSVEPVLMQKLLEVVKKMANREGLDKGKGYRIGINAGGAEAIKHFHIHLMGPIKNTDGM